jgi:phosphate transport system permease protein
MGKLVLKPRAELFEGTSLEPLFGFVEQNLEAMLLPRRTLYWQFFIDESFDAHFFGGIWSEILGTLYLTIGAMLFAVPMGVIAAIYLCEYAKEGRVIGFLRTCINTLAGVPSIVFGLFGLAFFINSMHVSQSKSVLAGSLTLSLLVLPTIIRASEEAILAVPRTYKEAALSLGSTSWHTVLTVILPAALPGILTGIVISMGRAAGETAPIIFTAAVSVGNPLNIMQTLSEPTMALPWNIYNLATEHEAVDEIRHVQYGMVLTLVAMVLMLNMAAIILRARISKKLKG